MMNDQQAIATMRAASFTATIQYGVLALQGLATGNGGAIAAIMALNANNGNLREYAYPCLIFAIGFVCAITSSFLSYISQSNFSNAISDTMKLGSGQTWRGAAIAVGCFSIVCMIGGGFWSFLIAIGCVAKG